MCCHLTSVRALASHTLGSPGPATFSTTLAAGGPATFSTTLAGRLLSPQRCRVRYFLHDAGPTMPSGSSRAVPACLDFCDLVGENGGRTNNDAVPWSICCEVVVDSIYCRVRPLGEIWALDRAAAAAAAAV